MTIPRLLSEQQFHDQQAQARAVTFAQQPDRLCFADDAYLDHESWIRPALDRLGDVAGLDVLDHGCGHGMAATVLARRGARVTAFDLSPGYVAEAAQRAKANGVQVACLCADGEHLPFAASSFDRIWGNAILHHLDLDRAAQEIKRVLRPGGYAVFCEPWGGNPLLHAARRFLPYPGKERTPDERPLRPRDLTILRAHFPGLRTQGFQFLSMVRRLASGQRWVRRLEAMDQRLLTSFPRLQHFCRYVVLTLPANP